MKWLIALLLCSVFISSAISEVAHAQKSKTRFRSKKSSTAAVPSEVNSGDYNTVKEGGKTVIYRKKNVVDFDDSLIEGELKNPNEFYFVHRPEEKFGSLVKKRPNFHKEMLRDSVMMR